MSEVRRIPGWTVLLVAVALVAATRGATPAARPTNTSAGAPVPMDAAKDPRIADLDNQIKSLKAEYHAQLDPLETQVKGLREKFDPRITSLEDQRRTLVEAAKTPPVRALDDQEAAELKQLSDQEKTEVDKLRQRYADERKEVQAKYKERRQQLATK